MNIVSCISPSLLKREAERLGLEYAAIAAVAAVESGSNGAFLPSGDPVMLFERHVFHRETQGRFDSIAPDLSSSTPGGYGSVSSQPARLARAKELQVLAAVRSTSWGAFQIMGFNHRAAGYPDLSEFEHFMRRSLDHQFVAFVWFLVYENLVPLLKAKNWAGFAKRYNGKNYAQNKYDVKLAAAYAKYVVGEA